MEDFENENYFQTENINFPPISDKLIESLEKIFPDKLPLKQVSDFELGVLIGQQKVISKLKVEKENQEQRIII